MKLPFRRTQDGRDAPAEAPAPAPAPAGQAEKLRRQGERLDAKTAALSGDLAAAEAELEATRARVEQLKAAIRERAGDQQAARLAFLQEAVPFTPYVAADAEGCRYLLSTRDSNIGRALFIKHGRKELRVIPRILDGLAAVGAAPGRETLLDVGANIGTTSVDAVRRLGFRRVVAIEPEPENFMLLRLNAVLNGVDDRVTTHQVAVSDAPGVAHMDVAASNSGAYTLAGVKPGARGTIEVPTTTLDRLADEGAFDPAEVSFLWMDIEGYEVHALLGASRLLERAVPLVMELNPKLLRAAGHADDLVPALSEHYTHVAEVADLGRDRLVDAFKPVPALRDLMDATGQRHTDVVVCRRA